VPTVIPRLYRDDEDETLDPTKMGELVRFTLPSYSDEDELADQPPPVARIVHDAEAAEDEPTHADAFFLVHATAQTDQGKRRKNNEDSMLVVNDKSLFVVADGMGGHRGGEHASQLAVKTIGDAFRSGRFEGMPYESLPTQASDLARAIHMANRAVHDAGRADK
jgi:protein phosphatase